MRADDIRVLEQSLAETATRMEQLEEEIRHANPILRESWHDQLNELHARRERMERRLAELRLDQALEWERIDFATGLDRVVERVTRGMDHPLPPRH